MKRERYFRDELWRMFAIYAILPAVLFTFFCGILFMAVLLHGRERANRDYLAYVTGRVKQTVESCEQGIETLAELPQAVSGPGYVLERNRIFQIFYGISEQAGYEPELYLVDQRGRLLLSNKEKLPSYLNKRQEVEWGIYAAMDARPGQTAFRLMNGWDSGESTAVFGRWVGSEDGNVALFGLLRTGDTLLAATGRPYDTLEGVIGIGEAGKGCGTLREFGVNYDECPLLPDFTPDYDLIAEKARTATVVHIQRSRGYTQRNAFDLATIQKVADTARKANPNAVIFVDNCYGEFTQTAEPVAFGADIMAGSFIKNPGGGITPTGGYIAGRKDLVEKCSHRFTAPGIGGDLGCTQDSLRDTFLGFYYAPGVVCEALKTAIYAQCLLELAGVNPVPRYTADHNDIVTCFDSGSAAALTGFCAGIQHNSPVDSFASPEPADEPGYTDKVVMASGSFTEGSTIEISCDGPLRAPYTCYLQGGVNFTAGRAAVLNAVQNAFFAE